MRGGDIFCRTCGFKNQAAEAAFCHKCGNALRTGAKFCDMCGAESAPEPVRQKRGRDRGGHGLLPIVITVLLVVVAAAAFAVYTFVLSERQAGNPEPPAAPATPVSKDAPAPAGGSGSLPDVTEVAPNTDNNDDYIPIPDEIAAPGSPENSQTTGAGSAEIAPVSAGPISPEAQTPPSGAESSSDLEWTERDGDGYSFLAPRGRFLSSGEIVSIPGVVSGDHVRMRARPNTKGRILRQLDNGVSFGVTGRYSSGQERYYWFQVRNGKNPGWIYGEFLNVENTSSEVPGYQPPPAKPAPSQRPAPSPSGKSPGAETTQRDGGMTMIRTNP